jgi:hypothetical protein
MTAKEFDEQQRKLFEQATAAKGSMPVIPGATGVAVGSTGCGGCGGSKPIKVVRSGPAPRPMSIPPTRQT